MDDGAHFDRLSARKDAPYPPYAGYQAELGSEGKKPDGGWSVLSDTLGNRLFMQRFPLAFQHSFCTFTPKF